MRIRFARLDDRNNTQGVPASAGRPEQIRTCFTRTKPGIKKGHRLANWAVLEPAIQPAHRQGCSIWGSGISDGLVHKSILLGEPRAGLVWSPFYDLLMSTHVEPNSPKRVTLRTLRSMAARGEAFACLAAYDATTARWLDRAGVPVLLAGDSAAQVVLGYERTIDMPLEYAIEMTAALRRGAASALIMADMPFLSYQADDAEAIRNAGQFMTRGQADVVKIEADASQVGLVEKMTRAGIPVCAHVGLKPQSVGLDGTYLAAGRTVADARRVIADAVALVRAGAVLVLIEAVPAQVAEAIIARVSVPVIGIGAGPACHGQILVVHDLLGLSDTPPRFAEPVARMGESIQEAGAKWIKAVAERQIGGRGYAMSEGEAEQLARALDADPSDGHAVRP